MSEPAVNVDKQNSDHFRPSMLDLISPTYFCARWIYHRAADAEDRANRINLYNNLWFYFSMLSLVIFGVTRYCMYLLRMSEHPDATWGCILYLWGAPISRSVELFRAFLKDAQDQLKGGVRKSTLSAVQRIRRVFYGYTETVVNFGIIYMLVPAEWFKESNAPSGAVEAVYFSAVTITTIGYGDIVPSFWATRILVVFEVFLGLVLLLLAFSVYANGAASGNRKTNI